MILQGINSALSGLKAFSKKINNSANNIANLNTAGYKKRELITQESGKSGGVQVTSSQTSQTQGSVLTTGNPLNIAINGSGYLRIQLPNGQTGYTRSGFLKKDANGRLATSDGNSIIPEITFPANSNGAAISKSGIVSTLIDGQSQVVGQIELTSFQNPGGLISFGNGLFGESNASGPAINGNPNSGGFGSILQGSIESSNVDIVEESVNMITASAGFKANINVLKAHEELLGSIIDIKK